MLWYYILMLQRSIGLCGTEMSRGVSWIGPILIADCDRWSFSLSATECDFSFGSSWKRNIIVLDGLILKKMISDRCLIVIWLSIGRTWVSGRRDEFNLLFGCSRWWGLCSNGQLIGVSCWGLIIYMRVMIRNHISRAGWTRTEI